MSLIFETFYGTFMGHFMRQIPCKLKENFGGKSPDAQKSEIFGTQKALAFCCFGNGLCPDTGSDLCPDTGNGCPKYWKDLEAWRTKDR